MKKRLIVGITGATGAIYGVELLRALNSLEDWESHLVLTDAGVLNVWHELKMKRKELERLADVAYHPKDIAADHRQRLVPHRRHGDRALLDEDARRGGARARRRPRCRAPRTWC